MFLFLLVRAYTESRPFLRLPHLVGLHKEMGGVQPGQLIPTDPGDIPDLWCHGQHTELGEEVGERLSPAYPNALAPHCSVSCCLHVCHVICAPALASSYGVHLSEKNPTFNHFYKKPFFHPDSVFIRYFYLYVSLLLDHCYKNLKNRYLPVGP